MEHTHFPDNNDDVFHSTQLNFNGVDYSITVSTANDTLTIDVEEVLTGEKWKGQFPAKCMQSIR